MGSVRKLATDDEFCAFAGITKQQSAQLRYLGRGPRFIRVTGRQIRYDWSEIEAWCESRTVSRSDQRKANFLEQQGGTRRTRNFLAQQGDSHRTAPARRGKTP